MKNQLLLGTFIILIAPTSLFDQQPAGVLNGWVYDKDGQPISYATVSIIAINTHSSADYDGHFEFTQLLPETYQLEVSAVGYQTKHKTVTVKAGSTTTVDIICRPSNGEMHGLLNGSWKNIPASNISTCLIP